MANELHQDYLTGKVTYFLLRSTTGQIWNGGSLENYNSANYATYVITATEQGAASSYYTGDMPVIAAGLYYLVAKERVGGSPAESDISIGHGQIQWNGTVALPLVYVASGASVFLASGTVSGQMIAVFSGSLSGQAVNLLSGNQVQVWSGTNVNLFSGQTTQVLSGLLYIASGNPVATLDKSGYSLSSGGNANLSQNVIQRNLSGLEGGMAKQSLGGAALKITAGFYARSGTTTYADGTTVFMTQTVITGSGMTPIAALTPGV